MFGRILALIVILSTQVACAKPNYAASNVDGLKKSQVTAECPVKFKSGLCVSYEWETLPTKNSFGSFIFKTYKHDAGKSLKTAVDIPATPAVVLWMRSMGHGSSPVTVEQLDVGVYRATNVYFSMRGPWEILFQSTNGDVVLDEAVIEITW